MTIEQRVAKLERCPVCHVDLGRFFDVTAATLRHPNFVMWILAILMFLPLYVLPVAVIGCLVAGPCRR